MENDTTATDKEQDKKPVMQQLDASGPTVVSDGEIVNSPSVDNILDKLSEQFGFPKQQADKPPSKPDVESKPAAEPPKAEPPAAEKQAVEQKPAEPAKADEQAKKVDDGADLKVAEREVEKAPDIDAEAELKSLPEPKNKADRRYRHLLKRIVEETQKRTTTEKAAQEKDAKLAALQKELDEAKSASTKYGPDIDKQLEELTQYRRQYELEKSPEIQQKFDAQIASAEKTISETLKAYGISDGTLKTIADNGGWAQFSRSRTRQKLNDGTEKTYAQIAADWMRAIGDDDPVAKAELDVAMQQQVKLQRERAQFIQDEKARAKEYFTKREEESRKSAKETEDFISNSRNLVDGWYKKATTTVDWLREEQVPADAPEAKRKEIAERNEFAAQLRGLLQSSLSPKNPQEFVTAALESVQFHHERKQHEAAKAKIAALEEELTKLKNAGRTIPRGHVGTPVSKTDSAPKKFDFSAEFDRIGQGIVGED